MLNLAEVKLDKPQDRANRAEEALQDLPEGDRDLARRVLGPIAAEYLIGAPDREKIRRALRVMVFCCAVIIAANGGYARQAREGFVTALDRSIRKFLGI